MRRPPVGLGIAVVGRAERTRMKWRKEQIAASVTTDIFDIRCPKNIEMRIVVEVWEASVRRMFIVVGLIITIAGSAGPVVHSLVVMAARPPGPSTPSLRYEKRQGLRSN